jgi:hypothetical protein
MLLNSLQCLQENENRSLEMGKSMYNFGKQGKEKARQQKQMDKAAKRIAVKQQKANLKSGAPDEEPATAESELAEGAGQSTTSGQDEPG